ncbi:hypothetical protein BD779DRAFT_604154 [Infundibulicybe gibba]|nr:hypothetical protein BD779DRAFT_604154 [Infundibulicybe gibba]
MSPYVFPPEIIDTILDALHADPDTLKTCILVCKAWQPRCRHHLFQSACLNLDRPDRVEPFLAELDAPHSFLAAHVRSLSLRGVPPKGLEIHRLSALRHVECLEMGQLISAGVWKRPSDEDGWLRSFSLVRKLHLDAAPVNLHDFLDVLRSLPSLQVLVLNFLAWGEAGRPEPKTAPIATCIHTLCLKTHAYDSLPTIIRLFEHRVMPRISNVHLQALTPATATISTQLFKTLGLALQHLTISAFYLTRGDVENLLDLGSNPNLKSIHFKDLAPAPIFKLSGFSWTIALLQTVTTATVVHLTFEMWLLPNETLDGVDWPLLKAALARPQFARLQTLCFELRAKRDHVRWLEQRISWYLNGAVQQGVLRFPTSPNDCSSGCCFDDPF